MEYPLISVVIPCFNQGEFVPEALASIFSQDYPSVEILIINDGSTDPLTIKTLEAISYPNVHVISTVNRGLASARNLGVERSNGEFVQFLDADDILLPQKFKKQMDVLRSSPDVDVCYSSYFLWHSDTNLREPPYANLSLGDQPLRDFLFHWERGLSIPIHCGLFRKSCWRRSPPFYDGLRSKEDWVMWSNLAKADIKFLFLDEALVLYRRHSGNMTARFIRMQIDFASAAFIIKADLPPSLRLEFEDSVEAHADRSLYQYYCGDHEKQIKGLVRDYEARIRDLDRQILLERRPIIFFLSKIRSFLKKIVKRS